MNEAIEVLADQVEEENVVSIPFVQVYDSVILSDWTINAIIIDNSWGS